MILSHILAIDNQGAIGKDNKLPWHLPEDLKFFKETTQGKIMIMGRKTFDSLGRVLPGRLHIVITRQHLKSDHERVVYVSSLDQAIQLAKKFIPEWPDEIFIIGGAEIFKQSLDQVDQIYLTKIDKVVDGDTFYPEVDWAKFDLIKHSQFETSEKFSINLYRRKV